MRHVNGEDLAVIMVDRGMVDDHLPNNVLAALKRCQREARAQGYGNASEADVAVPMETLRV